MWWLGAGLPRVKKSPSTETPTSQGALRGRATAERIAVSAESPAASSLLPPEMQSEYRPLLAGWLVRRHAHRLAARQMGAA